MKSAIKIDSIVLTEALESHSNNGEFFLDRESGQIIISGDSFGSDDDEDEDDDLSGEPKEAEKNGIFKRKKLLAEPERFVQIESVESRRMFSLMEVFAEQVADKSVQHALFKALSERKPFRKFKDSLSNFPKVEKAWFEFHEAQMLEIAKRWLSDNDIEAELY